MPSPQDIRESPSGRRVLVIGRWTERETSDWGTPRGDIWKCLQLNGDSAGKGFGIPANDLASWRLQAVLSLEAWEQVIRNGVTGATGAVGLCFLAQFSDRPCEGRLRAVHLIDKQVLRREGHDPWDDRSWVWACGGIVGLSGHHGQFDQHRLIVPRESLPQAVEVLAAEVGLLAWLDRRYGPRKDESVLR